MFFWWFWGFTDTYVRANIGEVIFCRAKLSRQEQWLGTAQGKTVQKAHNAERLQHSAAVHCKFRVPDWQISQPSSTSIRNMQCCTTSFSSHLKDFFFLFSTCLLLTTALDTTIPRITPKEKNYIYLDI